MPSQSSMRLPLTLKKKLKSLSPTVLEVLADHISIHAGWSYEHGTNTISLDESMEHYFIVACK